jgi:SAM-dependent methyltransferase
MMEEETRTHEVCLSCGATTLQALGYEETQLMRCARCALVFDQRIPSVEELIAHYSGYVREVGFDSPVSQRRRHEIISELSPHRVMGRLLDVGCGVGGFLEAARGLGWQTFGTEYTDEAVQLCTQRGHAMHQGALVEAGYEAGSFDVIIYSEVIEHIYNHQEEFAEVRRLLRPGGVLYITTPNFNALERRLLGARWNVIQYPEHLVYFTPTTMNRLLVPLGFKPQRVVTTGLSVSRLRQSLGSNALATHTRERAKSGDERLRTLTERPLMAVVKRLINNALTQTQLGNTIQGWYIAEDASH